MKINVDRSVARQWGIGIALILLSSIMAYKYFTVKDTWSMTKDLVTNFYPQLRADWINLRIGDMEKVMSQGEPDLWHTMILRTAMSRWRLRYVSEKPFNALMERYGNGLWLSPTRDEWKQMLATADAKWIDARRNAALTNSEAAGAEVIEQQNFFIVGFAPDTKTCELGSALRFVFDAEPGNLPKSPPYLLWSTKTPFPPNYRRRLGTWNRIDGATPPLQRFSIEFDLSWEPGWVSPTAQAEKFFLLTPGQGSWRMVRLEFGDSPYLKPGV